MEFLLLLVPVYLLGFIIGAWVGAWRWKRIADDAIHVASESHRVTSEVISRWEAMLRSAGFTQAAKGSSLWYPPNKD